MLGLWAQARTLYHALTADNDLPPTQKEHEGKSKPSWSKIEQARKDRQQHDAAWIKALASPQHFGAFVGMPDVLGEPPPEKVITPEERRAEKERFLKERFAKADEVLDRFAAERPGQSLVD